MQVSHMFFSLFKKIILLWLVLPLLHLLLFASSIMGRMDLMHVLSAYHRCNMCYVNIPSHCLWYFYSAYQRPGCFNGFLMILYVHFQIQLKPFFMGTKTVEELQDNSAGVHFSGLHVDDLEQRNSKELPATSAIENGYREPFVIG